MQMGHGHHGGHEGEQPGKGDLLADTHARLSKGEIITAGDHEHMAHPGSVREVEHNGHRITIRTHYEIEVDGRPLEGHIYVSNDGSVSSHALPAYSFSSAVDLVAKLIDLFPQEFEKPKRRKRSS
jgi:hypothetical protein